jgi:hypothetical protein
MNDKKAILEVGGDRGFLKVNEAREILNLAPLTEEEGGEAIFIRGEYYTIDSKMADEEAETEATDNAN